MSLKRILCRLRRSHHTCNCGYKVYNVRHFGAKGNGSTDDTAAIQAAIDAIPNNEDTWGPSNNRVDHGYILYFPTPPAGGAYVINSQLTLPGNKNIRLLGDTFYSARLLYRGSGDYAFRSDGGRRSHIFENLFFHRGGVLLAEDGRNVTDFIGCSFTAINDYGIKTDGMSVVGVRIINCEFAETSGGVGILHHNCDNWIIGDNTKFVRISGIGVECHSSGVTIRDARFETKAAGFGSLPHIRIEPDGAFAGGLAEVTGCRFGGEVPPGTDGPAEFAIQLGSADPATGTMTGIFISRNRFFRRNRGPTITSGRGAIRLTKDVKECIVSGNHFQQHFGPLIQEDQLGGSPYSNYFTANAIDTVHHTAGIFSGTHRGWIIH